jgi:hypothetical protein
LWRKVEGRRATKREGRREEERRKRERERERQDVNKERGQRGSRNKEEGQSGEERQSGEDLDPRRNKERWRPAGEEHWCLEWEELQGALTVILGPQVSGLCPLPHSTPTSTLELRIRETGQSKAL